MYSTCFCINNGNSESDSTTGSYTVTYQSDDQCTAPTSAVTKVTVNPIPPQPTITAGGPLIFCNGGSVSLTASTAGFSGGTYTWSTGSTSNPLVVTTSGSYTVTYVSTASCTAPVSASKTVTVNPIPPQPTITADGSLIFCDGGSVNLTAEAAGFTGGTYTWSNGSTDNPLLVTTSGNYTVTYKSADNCTALVSAATTVTVNPIPPQPTITAGGPLIFCDGGSVSLTAAAAGFTAGTYTWSTGSTDNPLVVTTSGSYTVTYTSTANCIAPTSASTTVTVNPIPPQPTIEADGPLAFCEGGSVMLTASSPGFTGGIYSWSNGSNINPLTVNAAGTYTVTYKSASGCPATGSASVDVIVNPIPPQPVVTATGNTNICPGETVTMNASVTGYSGTFEWFEGTQSLGVSNTIDLTTPDSYSVLFKTNEGCVSNIAKAFSITARPFNSAVDLGIDLVVCNNYVELLATSPLFGKGSWSLYDAGLKFDTKADSSYVRISGLVDGHEYKFVYKVSGECGDDRMDTIKVHAGVPGFKIGSLQTPKDTMCVGVARTVEVNVTGGSGKYIYHWLNAATNDTINTTVNSLNITPASILTTYYVYVEDKVKTGCKTFADTILISALEKQKLLVPNLITPNKDGMNDEFKIVEVDNYNNKMFPSGSYVEVYNRWGTRVYQANNYDGTWKGESTEDGMYFYYVKTGCGGEEFKGWLQILGNVN